MPAACIPGAGRPSVARNFIGLNGKASLPAVDVATHKRIASVLLKLARPDQALPHLRAVAEALPEDVERWERLCGVAALLGDVSGEIEVLERRLEVGHADPSIHARLVVLLLRADRRARAADHLDRLGALATDEGTLRLYFRARAAYDPAAAPWPAREGEGVIEGECLRRLLAFVHAYKTGGTSLLRGLRAVFAPAALRMGNSSARSDLARKIRQEKRPIDLLVGHVGYDLVESELVPLFRKEPLYIGLVRDPVARAKSIYAYFSSAYTSPEDRRRRLRTPHDEDINVVMESWLNAKHDWSGWRHDQCRVICGEPSAEAAIRTIKARYLTVVVPSRIDWLIAECAEALGRAPPELDHAKRTDSGRLVLDPVVERRLREHYGEDQKLFDWVSSNEDLLLSGVKDRIRQLMAVAFPARRPSADPGHEPLEQIGQGSHFGDAEAGVHLP